MKLLNLRQHYKDWLDKVRASEVIDIISYRMVLAKFETCEQMLLEYRETRKHKDIA